jgi:hypothetical protein
MNIEDWLFANIYIGNNFFSYVLYFVAFAALLKFTFEMVGFEGRGKYIHCFKLSVDWFGEVLLQCGWYRLSDGWIVMCDDKSCTESWLKWSKIWYNDLIKNVSTRRDKWQFQISDVPMFNIELIVTRGNTSVASLWRRPVHLVIFLAVFVLAAPARALYRDLVRHWQVNHYVDTTDRRWELKLGVWSNLKEIE